MTVRLAALCNEIRACNVFADIGCDHGYLAEYALVHKQCNKVIINDKSLLSLKKAQKLLLPYVGQTLAVCSDGGEVLHNHSEIDQVAICGMGGMEMQHILKHMVAPIERMLLQPMKDVYTLKKYLVSLRYGLERDVLVKSGGQFYQIIVATTQGYQPLSELQLRFPLSELQSPSRDFVQFLNKRKQQLHRIMRLGVPNARLAAIETELKQIEELL